MDEFLYRARPWANTLVAHNWPVMVCLVLIVLFAVRAYLRPTRSDVLALYGFSILALGFEYYKHARSAVASTVAYLLMANPDQRLPTLWFVEFALAPTLYGAGFGLLVMATLNGRKSEKTFRPLPPGATAGATVGDAEAVAPINTMQGAVR
jgi:hypothetical protein